MPSFENKDLPLATKAASTSTVISPSDLDVDWGDQDVMSLTDGLERLQPAGKTPKMRVAHPSEEFRLPGTTRRMPAPGIPLDRISATVPSAKPSDASSDTEHADRTTSPRGVAVDDSGESEEPAPASAVPPNKARSEDSGGTADVRGDLNALDSEEKLLAREVGQLWSSGQMKTRSIHRNREELSKIRTELSQRLYDSKGLLARKGRGGQWTAFLRETNIPRATADRCVRKWELSLVPLPEKRLIEAFPVPTAEEIAQMVAKLKPKLLRILTTSESVARFVSALAKALQEAKVV
jgi:hypothetical protein